MAIVYVVMSFVTAESTAVHITVWTAAAAACLAIEDAARRRERGE